MHYRKFAEPPRLRAHSVKFHEANPGIASPASICPACQPFSDSAEVAGMVAAAKMNANNLRNLFSAASVYLFAEVFTKLVQTVVILGIAAASTKPQYASFVLVFALHLLASAVVSGGAVEALTAARSRSPDKPAKLLMWPTLVISGGISVAVLIGGFCWAIFSLFGPAGETTLVTVVGATVSAVGIGIVRNASTVVQLEGRHSVAATVRSAQLLLGYLLGVTGMYMFSADPIGGFFCGYAVGVCAVGFCVAKLESIAVAVPSRSSDAKALLRDTIVFLPVALFGWLFGYGFSWLIEFANRPRSAIAEFMIVLSATFFCPMILNSVYATWSPQFAGAIHADLRSREKWNRLNRVVWQLPIVALGAIGMLLIFAWDYLMRTIGYGLVQYRFLERSLTMVFIGYVFLSLHYVVTVVFVREQASALFFRVSVIGNLLGIGVAALFLHASSLNIAFGYSLALAVRGAMLALVAWSYWRVPLPLLEIFIASGALLAGLLAMEYGSLSVKIGSPIVLLTLLAVHAFRLRSQFRRLL